MDALIEIGGLIMAFFDKLKSQAASAVTNAVKNTAANIGTKSEKIVFADLPESLEAFKELPQAALSTPFAASTKSSAAVSTAGS